MGVKQVGGANGWSWWMELMGGVDGWIYIKSTFTCTLYHVHVNRILQCNGSEI